MIQHPRRLRDAMRAFDSLDNYFNADDYRYVLRSLYRIVEFSQKAHEPAQHLSQRLRQFERDCLLPALFSSLPLIYFLEALEQMQYLYPICSREVAFFPLTFHLAELRRGQ